MSKVFSCSGDAGDLIAALPTIKAMGGGRLVLFPADYTGYRMTTERVESLRPLLECQDYIEGVEWAAEPSGVNLDDWRNHYVCGLNIADMVSSTFGQPHYPRNEPWLTVGVNKVSRIIFHRSPRYRNWGCYPVWKRAWQKYKNEAVFVGGVDEHAEFCHTIGTVPYYPTANYLELAEVINGSDLYMGNQSSPFWVAEGLKKRLILEACANPSNCHFDRSNSIYCGDPDTVLPDLTPLVKTPPSMTIVVISWRRPHLLRDTLASIEARLSGLGDVDLVCIDNESTDETKAIIEASRFRIVPLHWNAGICYSVEHIIAPAMTSDYICVSDHDIYYGRDFVDYINFLRDNPDVMFAKGIDSPEHEAFGTRYYAGETWHLKHSERGAGVIMRSSDLRAAFPLPGHPINFDWHLTSKGTWAVLPASVAHTGWRDSTREGIRGTAEKFILRNGVIVPFVGRGITEGAA